jgi:hypothetical protein
MSGLTNGYVEKIGKEHCKNFIGVFPCNIHPKLRNNQKFSLIFNESKHDESGTHFVAVFYDCKNVYYFDPLGLQCENDYILRFLSSFNKTITQNKTQIQSYNSIYCGYFCLAFVIFMTKQNNLNKFLHIFNVNNLKLNDEIVVEFLINIL